MLDNRLRQILAANEYQMNMLGSPLNQTTQRLNQHVIANAVVIIEKDRKRLRTLLQIGEQQACQ